MVAKTLKIVFCVVAFVFCGQIASHATEDLINGTQIYDAQLNEDLKTLLAPLAQTAGIDIKQSRLYLIVDASFGAWATVDNTFGLNTGLLGKCDTVEQFLGVMAHEFGHVNAGHIARTQDGSGRIAKQGMIVTGLAALAGVAAGKPDAAAAALMAGMSLTERGILSYSRGQEYAADQAAVKFFQLLNWPVSAIMEVMLVIIKREEIFRTPRDVYISTHPATNERGAYLKSFLKDLPALKAGQESKVPDSYKGIWENIQLKLKGIIDEPKMVLEDLKTQDSNGALVAKAIAHLRLTQIDQALRHVNTLLKRAPLNPHYYGLKAEILWANGNLAGARDAYAQAQKLMPDEVEYQIGYATSLINLKQDLDKAAELLEAVVINSKRIGNAWEQLKKVYGAQNRQGELAWVEAEVFAQWGEIAKAKASVLKAERLLDKKSKYYLFVKVLSANLSE